MIDIAQLTSKTAISAYVVAVSLPVAVTAGDRVTQIIAGVIALVAFVALGVFAPDANQTITTKQIAELPDNTPIKKSDLVKPDPSAAIKVDHSEDTPEGL